MSLGHRTVWLCINYVIGATSRVTTRNSYLQLCSDRHLCNWALRVMCGAWNQLVYACMTGCFVQLQELLAILHVLASPYCVLVTWCPQLVVRTCVSLSGELYLRWMLWSCSCWPIRWYNQVFWDKVGAQWLYATNISPAQVLQSGLPTTMTEVVSTVELLQEASLWFPGGSKEMRVRALAYL